MIYAGVDPGAKGGLSAIWDDKKIICVLPMSRENLVDFAVKITTLATEQGTTISSTIEKVGAMPGQGVTSMFNFGKNAGFIEGVFESFGIPYQLIPPQRWKKEFGLIHKDKQDSINTCKALFPSANLLPTPRCRKDSDGMGESLLMAEYARRKL